MCHAPVAWQGPEGGRLLPAPRGIRTTPGRVQPRQALGPCWGHSGLDVLLHTLSRPSDRPQGCVTGNHLVGLLGPTCPKGTGSPSLQSCWRAPGEGEGPIPGTTEWLWKGQKEGGRQRAPWALGPRGRSCLFQVWPPTGRPFSAGGHARTLTWSVLLHRLPSADHLLRDRSGPRFTCLGPPGPAGGRPPGHAGSPHHASPAPTTLAFLCVTSGSKLNSLCLRVCLITLGISPADQQGSTVPALPWAGQRRPASACSGPRWLTVEWRTLSGLIHFCDFASNMPGFWAMVPPAASQVPGAGSSSVP